MTTPFAVFVIIQVDGGIAATTRASDKGEGGRIGLPGGKVDEGETPVDAVIRESREEGWAIGGVNSSPIRKEIFDGQMVWWYKAKHGKPLTNFKEKHRGISPIVVDIDTISGSGYGNEFISNMFESDKNRIVKIFLESTSNKRWFHGDTSRRKDFCDQNMQRDLKIQSGNAAGPGIYFTDDKPEAMGYADKGGFIYTVDIDIDGGKIITADDLSSDNSELLISLIKKAWSIDNERVFYQIADYMEGAVTEPEDVEEWMFGEVVSKYMNNDILLNDAALIGRDFFESENIWAETMVELGIIGYLPSRVDNTTHLVIYDCGVITIVKEEKYG